VTEGRFVDRDKNAAENLWLCFRAMLDGEERPLRLI
jgi:hypothetical protein